MQHKNIVILGAGESGTGAAVLAQKLGMRVFVSDNGSIAPKFKAELNQNGIEYEENGHTENCFDNPHIMIKSPGIPDTAKCVQKAYATEIPVVDEIEFASWYTNAKIIAITGSNGKTTTASLLYHILSNSGCNASLAGNIGRSFARAVANEKPDYFVLELSSFQLDYCFSLKADIAILLNITPDHLDRYNNDFQKYTNSKFGIIRNMQSTDHLIYNADDPVIVKELNNREPALHKHPISLKKAVENGAYLRNQQIEFTGKNPFIMTIEELALQGKHNVYNSMAAGVASRLIDIRKESIKNCLSDFQNIEHRLEHVAGIHGIDFINDSKATNVNSTWYALESMNKPVIWLAGGLDKGNDYQKLKEIAAQKVKMIICIGKDNTPITDAFGGIIEEIYETPSMTDAVHWAYKTAEDGDAVLLSPACASFDFYKNYEERGQKFKEAVKKL
ncbi:MAG: UDP-N-acetylmuramoyl-L-alanine--D-glutamate ligase [Bacteroidota bacterium]